MKTIFLMCNHAFTPLQGNASKCICDATPNTTNEATMMTGIICGTILILGIIAMTLYFCWKWHELKMSKESELRKREWELEDKETKRGTADRDREWKLEDEQTLYDRKINDENRKHQWQKDEWDDKDKERAFQLELAKIKK